ncbi:elongation factor G [Sciscionella marina]|uniref:elongation factor G n=1 Tax=Sciscionella marina TaxID=508770 RepID=UPI00036AA4A5|nr:TetM/TetW/TetO/TetS family tetracycline resistance ribosomal protection protein [Sciscionella marina]
METINIGILAHVDAGKTSLTERLLFDAGATRRLGSVDEGTTRTDSSELERARGITIRAGVAAFEAGGCAITILDTPGHPDFIAEVERALRVLDGAVLVVSGTSGVQAQTTILLRALHRMRVPTLLFVNKMDSSPYSATELLTAVRARLTATAVTGPEEERSLEVLAERDDRVLADYLAGVPDRDRFARALREQTARAQAHPVLFGSATSGAGIPGLVTAIRELIPVPEPGAEPPRATVFQIEGKPREALVRVHAGEFAERAMVTVYRRTGQGIGEHKARITGLRRISPRGTEPAGVLGAGAIGWVRGLGEARVGDQLGSAAGLDAQPAFPPPPLESVVTPVRAGARSRLFAALTELADADPLIGFDRGSGSVRIHGEVQQEVLEARLREEFGVRAWFAPVTPVLVHRPRGTGSARRSIDSRERNEYWATIGLEVEPGTGVDYRIGVQRGLLPRAFYTAIEETVHEAAAELRITDCRITLTAAGYASPVSTAGDFRALTRKLFGEAIEQAGLVVYRPVHRFELEFPEAAASRTLAALAKADGIIEDTGVAAGITRVTGTIPVAELAGFRRRLPGCTGGEGVLLSRPDGYRPG